MTSEQEEAEQAYEDRVREVASEVLSEMKQSDENDFEYCGYCSERMFWDDEHDDYEVCASCLVKVPDEELKEMGLI